MCFALDGRNDLDFRDKAISRCETEAQIRSVVQNSFKKPRSYPLLSSSFVVELDPGDVGKCARACVGGRS